MNSYVMNYVVNCVGVEVVDNIIDGWYNEGIKNREDVKDLCDE